MPLHVSSFFHCLLRLSSCSFLPLLTDIMQAKLNSESKAECGMVSVDKNVRQLCGMSLLSTIAVQNPCRILPHKIELTANIPCYSFKTTRISHFNLTNDLENMCWVNCLFDFPSLPKMSLRFWERASPFYLQNPLGFISFHLNKHH